MTKCHFFCLQGMAALVCKFKNHDWVYCYETYFDESFERYWERWEERHCERCGKSQERKVDEGIIKRSILGLH